MYRIYSSRLLSHPCFEGEVSRKLVTVQMCDASPFSAGKLPVFCYIWSIFPSLSVEGSAVCTVILWYKVAFHFKVSDMTFVTLQWLCLPHYSFVLLYHRLWQTNLQTIRVLSIFFLFFHLVHPSFLEHTHKIASLWPLTCPYLHRFVKEFLWASSFVFSLIFTVSKDEKKYNFIWKRLNIDRSSYTVKLRMFSS
jgi:hypothetical protein